MKKEITVFSERVTAERERLGMKQEDLAEALTEELSKMNPVKYKDIKINPSTISGYENGYRKPDHDYLMALCRILFVSADYLIGLINERKPYTETISNEDELRKALGFTSEDVLLFRKAKTLSPEAWEKIRQEIDWLQKLDKGHK